MTAEAERRAYAASRRALRARAKRDEWFDEARRRTVEFIDAALEAGFTWDQMGDLLDLEGTSVRLYYKRNRRYTHGRPT